ncbi:hypothetical protein L226DRAFT_535594 [Lentinus tigrinus ALCF2SS1-7]|uniref:Uncharacterized protein n=1 Tax=Lentinus tigrinus ALCF2SS1-6 TaxID=1328759 RepID=A0A5C2RTE7_9APHY|nr:hypothetical protein L227DRAFT_615771 [Lentinus tigrinus ALCF2SS1-6]RPD74124.1 hypothetical protein L226DRAFT_535594 [Lentinus tigrinus ALCF2SS1-7]
MFEYAQAADSDYPGPQYACQVAGRGEKRSYAPSYAGYMGIDEELMANYLLFEFPNSSIASCNATAQSAPATLSSTSYAAYPIPPNPNSSPYATVSTQQYTLANSQNYDAYQGNAVGTVNQDVPYPDPTHIYPPAQATFVDPASLFGSGHQEPSLDPARSDPTLSASSSSSRTRHSSSRTSTSSSPYPYPSPSPDSELSRPDLITCKRRNLAVAPSEALPPSAAPHSKWQCPYCPHFQHNRRSPDFKRHLATHTRPEDKALWVCCGVPLLEASACGVPEKVQRGELFEFEGVFMVGGCRKTFSRRDAYGRHLARETGRCFGDAHGLYQPGNRG